MAAIGVIALGPVEFTDAGDQFVIPLSLLSFDAMGALEIDWPHYAAHKAVLDPWLAYLKRSGALRPAPQPPPAAALVITAAAPGSTGNDIAIEFSDVDETAGTLTATLTQRDEYAGLTPATVAGVLGTTAKNGSRSGLIFVSSSGGPTQPANGSYPLTGGPKYTADLSDAQGGKAFTVRSRADDSEAANTTVEISKADDPAAPGTFTLTAVWRKQVTGIKPGDLQSSFAYEVTVDAPPGGQLLTPAPGTITLRGGSDLSGPNTASVTVSTQ